jgi:hypothetical protein
MSYFHEKAAQSYRRARSSLEPHADYEALMTLGPEFTAEATAAASRLARMRGTWLRKQEAERQEAYRDSRE